MTEYTETTAQAIFTERAANGTSWAKLGAKYGISETTAKAWSGKFAASLDEVTLDEMQSQGAVDREDAGSNPADEVHEDPDAETVAATPPTGQGAAPRETVKLTLTGPDYHVHAAGCRDIAKEHGDAQWTADYASAVEVAADIYSDMIAESGCAAETYLNDIHFAPCVTFPGEAKTAAPVKAKRSRPTPYDAAIAAEAQTLRDAGASWHEVGTALTIGGTTAKRWTIRLSAEAIRADGPTTESLSELLP